MSKHFAFAIAVITASAFATSAHGANCQRWHVAGDWNIEHQDGSQVGITMRQVGTKLSGDAGTIDFAAAKQDSGTVSGSIDGMHVQFEIHWQRKGSSNAYQGDLKYEQYEIGHWRAYGTATDLLLPSNWKAKLSASCARAPIEPGMMDNVDQRGHDFTNFALTSHLNGDVRSRSQDKPNGEWAPSVCQQACMADRRCRAWTVSWAGTQGGVSVCYLKDAAPPPVFGSCCVSGVLPSRTDVAKGSDPGPVAPQHGPGDIYGETGPLPSLGPKPGDKFGERGPIGPPTPGPGSRYGETGPIAPPQPNPGTKYGDQTPIARAEVTTPGMEENTDRPGADYNRFALNGRNPDQCQAACKSDSRCAAWTYVRPGLQQREAVCYLKDPAPNPVPHTCCISGIKRPVVGLGKKPPSWSPGPGDAAGEAGPIAPGGYQGAEENSDRPGSDYHRFLEPRPRSCYHACRNDRRCRAWTWVKPGVQEAQAVCYLKNAMPPPVTNSCCTSGVIVR